MDRARGIRQSNSAPDVAVDTSPLLGNGNGSSNVNNSSNSNNASEDASNRSGLPRRASIQGAARFLRRASSRRIMREPSMLVRETAAEQLEERQSDWAYSRPVVVLDIIWNLAFVIVAAVVLILSRDENPNMPIRVWVVGYALQCLLHMICVCFEYRRRHSSQQQQQRGISSNGGSSGGQQSPGSHQDSESDEEGDESVLAERTSIAKRLESANTMFSFIWWIVGFYWISAGGQILTHDAPQLYWLCVVFLAFDVFFVVFCVALACVIGIAVCCCLPCIIAILYAVADQEGASEEDISLLPKYQFRLIGGSEKMNGEKSGHLGGVMNSCGGEPSTERVLSAEDAECCICLSAYDNGVELRELPCGHHFHCACIDKWLRINATCPLCKYNIIKSSNNAREEV
uniref:RING-type E3 ubiquitin transferase n=1 Tax=Wollemia nobilis TaxID=56998 RepID=A0A0C9QVM2_9CONI